jgi:hypothetical protein
MINAPEKIWAHAPTTFDEMDVWQTSETDGAIEYTRTDVADARIEELKEALRVTEKALRVFGAKTEFYRVAARVARAALKGE